MPLKLKTKVALGGIFLFLLLLLVGGVSFYHFNNLIVSSKDVVKSNYESLGWGNNMLINLNEWRNSRQAREDFIINLQNQKKNITEPGEAALTRQLEEDYHEFEQRPDSMALLLSVQAGIGHIMQVNIKAINEKSRVAQKAAENAKALITIIITVCLLAGFTFIYNFPLLVAGPISKLSEAIKAISRKDYTYRVHIERNDEFGKLAQAFNNMAEQLDRYEHSNLATIMFEKQRAETVINSLQDASIGMDTHGIILFANRQALELLDIKENAILGKSGEDIKKQNDLFRYITESENKTPFKIIIDNRENYFIRENIEITNAAEKLGNVVILKNITSFKEMDVAKTNFIATVSHELKTPLASSDFSLKLLEDDRVGQLTEEQKQLVQLLKNDNQRMLRILSELLNMSQVEAGKIQLEIRPVNPGDAVESSVTTVLAQAKDKGITIDTAIKPGVPEVLADPDKISWVLNNFLTNAIRYSSTGSVIRIAVQHTGANISFSVRDQGQGIDEKYIDRIFERYFQVPGRADKAGSGIGLAICKEFIEAMGGTIWVQSQIGMGSTFGFDIPVQGNN